MRFRGCFCSVVVATAVLSLSLVGCSERVYEGETGASAEKAARLAEKEKELEDAQAKAEELQRKTSEEGLLDGEERVAVFVQIGSLSTLEGDINYWMNEKRWSEKRIAITRVTVVPCYSQNHVIVWYTYQKK